jgi:MFS transporter, FSR family, fosmidomycin resistance protein
MNSGSAKISIKSTVLYLSIYGTIHALVDATCAAYLLSIIHGYERIFNLLLLYNIIAFGAQLPLGLIVDRLQKPAMAALLGCILLIVAIFESNHLLWAVLVCGFGNALFHVGGGSIALNLQEKKAFLPGVFVAPGGIGLVIGIWLAKYQLFNPMIFVALLFIACLMIAFLRSPEMDYQKSKVKVSSYIKLGILLLAFSIIIRSTIGLSINFSWKSKIYLLVILTVFIALGKALGGLVADKFGWMKISLLSLIIAAFLLAFGNQIPLLAIAGIFLFNFTMPVTLVAISNLLPGRPGFSFGITTFALLLGSIPTFFQYKAWISNSFHVFLLVLMSVIFLFVGLMIYKKFSNVQEKVSASN